jgi:Domain of unknown function (DUF4259)
MGSWGIGLLDNDIATDARLTFDSVLRRGGSVANAITAVMEESGEDLDEYNDRADLILALAWLVSERQAVPDWLDEEARDFVESDQALERWEDSPDRHAREAVEMLLISVLDGKVPHPGRQGAALPQDQG